jgi:hypothetical protein
MVFIAPRRTEGFAYIPQAAVRLASRTLRIPHAMSAGTSLVSKKTNAPKGAFEILAETEGFAYIPQAAVRLARRTLRIPHAMSAGTSLVSFSKKNAH